jgi:hypothetical protein
MPLCYTHLRPRRGVAQPGSAPALGAGGRRFKSSRPDRWIAQTRGCSSMVELQPSKLAMGVRFPSPALRAPVAQGTEQRTSNPPVAGSNPAGRASKSSGFAGISQKRSARDGGITERFDTNLTPTSQEERAITPYADGKARHDSPIQILVRTLACLRGSEA